MWRQRERKGGEEGAEARARREEEENQGGDCVVELRRAVREREGKRGEGRDGREKGGG